MYDEKISIYRDARKRAAGENALLNNAATAQSLLSIDRGRLLTIEKTPDEKGYDIPKPDEVMIMAKVYEAPELINYYCTHQCPLRDKESKPLEYESLNDISVPLMSSLYAIKLLEKDIFKILGDGKIDIYETNKLKEIMSVLGTLSTTTSALKLWIKQNLD